MFIKSYFSHHLHQCQWIHDTSMYFLYKKQISYSALTIWIVQIVFKNQKMNKYEYQIPLFSPNYSNSLIVLIIRPNTASRRCAPVTALTPWSGSSVSSSSSWCSSSPSSPGTASDTGGQVTCPGWRDTCDRKVICDKKVLCDSNLKSQEKNGELIFSFLFHSLQLSIHQFIRQP